MGSRLLFTAIAALAALGLSAECRAEDGGYTPKHRHHRFYYGRPVGGYFGHPVGGDNSPSIGRYLFGDHPNPFAGTEAYNYPGFYNNQNFWERVETQRNYPVQY